MFLQEEKIQKISLLYLLVYIAGPILIFALSYFCFSVWPALAVFLLVIGIILWFFLFPLCCQKVGRNLLKKKAKESNLAFDDIFQSTDWFLIVDNRHGKLGLLLQWNPFHPYILSTRRVTQVSVDDGNMGNGFLGGTCRVRLLMFIDGKKISLTTFSTSFNNRRSINDSVVKHSIAETIKIMEAIQNSNG